MSDRPPSLRPHRGPGERAAALAAAYCTRRLGRPYAETAWQMLADAARLGVIRHGRPEAWAAGAVVALARVNGRLGVEGALTAQQVADELYVTVGTLAVTERELARVLNLARYARRLPWDGRHANWGERTCRRADPAFHRGPGPETIRDRLPRTASMQRLRALDNGLTAVAP